MTQIFILGASNAYGVGGESGGWADMFKSHLHQRMYGPEGLGETHELYNFAKPGADIGFVQQTLPEQLRHYGRNMRKIAILSVGMNDTKAQDTPENFVSSPEAFSTNMEALLLLLKETFNDIYILGYWPCDESQTSPKTNPFTGGKSYFSNARLSAFNQILKALCHKHGQTFLEVETQPGWTQACMDKDGLHPNATGHRSICNLLIQSVTL